MNYNLFAKTLLDISREGLAYKLGRKLALGSDKSYWNYIPSYENAIEDLLEQEIQKLKEINTLSFLDVGAGTSTIPTIMSIMGFAKSMGLEYQDLYVNLEPDWLFQGDLLDYDFKEWDVLYSYNPIQNEALMIKGIDNIIATMKSGAIFYFLPSSGAGQYLKKLGGRNLKGSAIIKYVKP
jgi:hypothetical protein